MSLSRPLFRRFPLAAVLLASVASQMAQAQSAKAAASASAKAPTTARYVAPRTPDGYPDLQGNWTNATLTPLERPPGLPRALSKTQAAVLEKIRADTVEVLAKPSDPNRSAPPVGGDGSTGAASGFAKQPPDG